VEDLGIFRSLGQPAIRITPSRTACGRYGPQHRRCGGGDPGAIGGLAITQVYEGEKHFELTVRWAEVYGATSAPSGPSWWAAPDGHRCRWTVG